MKKLNIKKLKPEFTLFLISIAVVIVLSLIKNPELKFVERMSNNFFVVGIVYLSVGVMFEITSWSFTKNYISKPVDKEEVEEIKHSHKDAGVVSSMNKDKEYKRRKEILNLLWKIFTVVGAIDFGLSILMILFI
ncbi:hypothetical protein [Sporanaerobacter acetigenes]|uniref:hypothetical protein n=1 Tax=Sporanaerobacter acetigenes TaxID=165813 RepID=UPI00332342D8